MQKEIPLRNITDAFGRIRHLVGRQRLTRQEHAQADADLLLLEEVLTTALSQSPPPSSPQRNQGAPAPASEPPGKASSK